MNVTKTTDDRRGQELRPQFGPDEVAPPDESKLARLQKLPNWVKISLGILGVAVSLQVAQEGVSLLTDKVEHSVPHRIVSNILGAGAQKKQAEAEAAKQATERAQKLAVEQQEAAAKQKEAAKQRLIKALRESAFKDKVHGYFYVDLDADGKVTGGRFQNTRARPGFPQGEVLGGNIDGNALTFTWREGDAHEGTTTITQTDTGFDSRWVVTTNPLPDGLFPMHPFPRTELPPIQIPSVADGLNKASDLVDLGERGSYRSAIQVTTDLIGGGVGIPDQLARALYLRGRSHLGLGLETNLDSANPQELLDSITDFTQAVTKYPGSASTHDAYVGMGDAYAGLAGLPPGTPTGAGVPTPVEAWGKAAEAYRNAYVDAMENARKARASGKQDDARRYDKQAADANAAMEHVNGEQDKLTTPRIRHERQEARQGRTDRVMDARQQAAEAERQAQEKKRRAEEEQRRKTPGYLIQQQFNTVDTLLGLGTSGDTHSYKMAIDEATSILTNPDATPDQKAMALYDRGCANVGVGTGNSQQPNSAALLSAAEDFRKILSDYPDSSWIFESHIGLGQTYVGLAGLPTAGTSGIPPKPQCLEMAADSYRTAYITAAGEVSEAEAQHNREDATEGRAGMKAAKDALTSVNHQLEAPKVQEPQPGQKPAGATAPRKVLARTADGTFIQVLAGPDGKVPSPEEIERQFQEMKELKAK